MKVENKIHLDREKIWQAATCIKELSNKFLEEGLPGSKKNLLCDESEGSIFLQVTLKKIPTQAWVKIIKIRLPHSLLKESYEVCLITGDLDKRDRKADIEPTVLYYKELLKNHGINGITEVLSLRQLRTEYRSIESKSALLGAYNVFLVDSQIAGCLPKLLGKYFFKKRKYPIQINMKSPNLKNQFDKALRTTALHLTGRGNSCVVEVGHHGLESEQIVKNVVAVANSLAQAVPGSFKNIMGLYLKSSRSLAIPIYLNFDNPNAVKLLSNKKRAKTIVGELSTLHNKNVEIYKDLNFRVMDMTDSDPGSEVKKQFNVKKCINAEQTTKHKLKSVKHKKCSKKLAEDETVNDSDDYDDDDDESDLEVHVVNDLKNKKQNLKKRKLSAISVNENDSESNPSKSRKKSWKLTTKITEIKKSKYENNVKTTIQVETSKAEKQTRKDNKIDNLQDSVKMIIPKKVDGHDSSQFKVFTPAERKTVSKVKRLRNNKLENKGKVTKAIEEINRSLKRSRKTDAKMN